MAVSRKVMQGQETRRRIIAAAVAVIEDPEKLMSTRVLLDSAGVTKGALYHHFTSLDEIWQEAFAAIVDGTARQQQFIDREADDLGGYFASAAGQFLRNMQDAGERTVVWSVLLKALGDGDSQYRDLFKDVVARSLDEWVKAAQKLEPSISRHELSNAFLALQALWLGLIAQARVDDDYDGKAEIFEWLAGMLVEHFQKEEGARKLRA